MAVISCDKQLKWQTACAQAECCQLTIGLDPPGGPNDGERLRTSLAAESKQGTKPLWLILIGHGTFDGKEARFNLRGPDVTGRDLAQWLKPFERPLTIIDTAAANAPFLTQLSASNRVILTATRSGREQNFAHFGQFLATAIADPQADLDKDGQVSLFEAFLIAARQTAEAYKVQGRLLTEHALIDDNGDGRGTPADWFRGLRVVKKTKEVLAVDGLLAQQLWLVPSPIERALSPRPTGSPRCP